MTKRLPATERKAAIVKAALPLFAKQGFAATTTKQLAKAAGVSEALLYRHFPSKESLYAEIKGFGSQGDDSLLFRLLQLPPSTETLVLLVYAMLRRFIVGERARSSESLGWDIRVRLMIQSCLDDGTFMRFLMENHYRRTMNLIRQSLEAATTSGELIQHGVGANNQIAMTHHLAIMLGCMHLPTEPAVDYQMTKDQLLQEATWYALRGIGLKEEAIRHHTQWPVLEQRITGMIE